MLDRQRSTKEMDRHTCACTLVIILVICEINAALGKSKPVSISLDAKWKSTPVLLEASEYIAKEGNEKFWNFVNAVADLDPQAIIDQHEEAMHHLALKHASRVLSPLQMRLLKFSLAMRAHSPTIEMYNQVARETNPTQECDTFVDVNQMVTCDKHAFKAFLSLADGRPKPVLFKSDHSYPSYQATNITVILYGQLGTADFHDYHKELKQMAEDGRIQYILRHYVRKQSDRKVRLSGYGVELAIKSTEYKAKDDTKVQDDEQSNDLTEKHDEQQGFLFSKLRELHPELKNNLAEFRKHLIESTSEMAPLKAWQMQDLSLQAAQKVLSSSSSEALGVLSDISQNFPLKARLLSKTTVKEDFKREMKKNQQIFEKTYQLFPGDSALFINGLQADLDIYDVFTLLDTMRSEARLMEGLHALGIKGDQLSSILGLDMKDSDSSYAVDMRDVSVQWINDLENEKRYNGWSSSLQEMLRPTFPGMLRNVRKNLFNLVFMIDPTDMALKEVLKMAEAFNVHQAPIRIGFVFVVNKEREVEGMKDAGVAMVRAFNFIKQDKSAADGLSFFTDVFEQVEGKRVSADIVVREFAQLYPGESLDMVFGKNSDYDDYRIRATNFHEKTGLGAAPQVLMNGVPMKKEALNADAFEEAVVTEILKTTPDIQRAVYHGHLTDHMDVFDWLMTRSHVMPRLNARILQGGAKHLDLTKATDSSIVKDTAAFGNLQSAEMTSALTGSLHYLVKKDEPALRPMTSFIVADLETPKGREIIYDAIKFLKSSNNMRIGIIYNPGDTFGQDSHFITKAIHVALETLPRNMAKSFVTKLLKEENVADLKSKTKTLNDFDVHGMDMEKYNADLAKQTTQFLEVHKMFCNRILEFKPSQRGIIINGKIIGPLNANEIFISEDFVLLDKFTSSVSADKIKPEISKMDLDEDKGSDMVMKVASLLTSAPQEESRKKVDYHGNQHSVLKIAGNPDSPAYDVVAIIDPLTRAAQKIAPLITVLREAVNVNINIFMNCKEKLSEMPLKSFYRYVLDPELKFTADSHVASGPIAVFNNLPESPIFTLNMNPPEGWLVESIKSVYDLDNIHLEEVQTSVKAEFELEYLLLEGHCYDTTSGQPPRGLQFILGTNTTQAVMDTIVMANLGYFQLKANPGAWMLRLRQGRSRDIFQITSHEYTDSPADAPDVVVVMDSFKSKIIKIRVSKKPGKEREDLLGDSNAGGGGLWDSISNKFTGSGATQEGEDETLNIFSLASGHLYERFLRIMMMSVLKNTKSKVKFWFLKNYLSPTFKEFIPHMAEEFGFQYELIQYKWPRWLHQQTEKQRMIWGYKILFLDVLFPLDVNKIIFVDADQIVRADLKELHDLDLEGAPYGYTPFCDSRTEMEGFRFWKSGYWASHLAGRRYHISALYVVDLKKFRKIAAGDRLRGQYQGLSQDPNSLSNLDQDLPNNMIHQVAIKSLPQEWLWCETWCSESSKASAKTIDLCNNPLTKEPKLEAAVRIVPEWTGYDKEIKNLWDKIYKNTSNKQNAEKTTDSHQKRDEL